MPTKTKTRITPTPAARQLAKQIVSDRNDLRVKFGRTNGQIVLHVYVNKPTLFEGAYTIRNAGEWAECPLNPERIRRSRRTAGESAEREQELSALEHLIANEDAI